MNRKSKGYKGSIAVEHDGERVCLGCLHEIRLKHFVSHSYILKYKKKSEQMYFHCIQEMPMTHTLTQFLCYLWASSDSERAVGGTLHCKVGQTVT